jgi:uncharacterized protein (TIGR02246 family)
MTRSGIRWSLAAAVVIGACQPQTSQSATGNVTIDTAGILAAIDTLAAKMGRANETGDAELFGSAWAEDGILAYSGNAPIRGRASIVAAFRSRPPLPPGMTMSIHPTEIEVLSSEWAYVMGVDSLKQAPVGSAAPITKTSTFLVLLRKTDEGWQTYREAIAEN